MVCTVCGLLNRLGRVGCRSVLRMVERRLRLRLVLRVSGFVRLRELGRFLSTGGGVRWCLVRWLLLDLFGVILSLRLALMLMIIISLFVRCIRGLGLLRLVFLLLRRRSVVSIPVCVNDTPWCLNWIPVCVNDGAGKWGDAPS